MCDKKMEWLKKVEPIKLMPQHAFNKNKIVIVNKKSKFLRKTGNLPIPIYKKSIIYESPSGEAFSGPPRTKLTIVNLLDLANNDNNRVIATFVDDSGKVILEKTSDKISQIIGVKNWNTLLSAIYSVIDQEQKARSVMALLTEISAKVCSCPTNSKDVEKIENSSQTGQSTMNKYCQTEQSSMNLLLRMKTRRIRQRRSLLTPYVVKKTSEPRKTVENDVSDNEKLEKIAANTLIKEPQVIKEEYITKEPDITIEEHNITSIEPDIITKIEPTATKEAYDERIMGLKEELDSNLTLPILNLNEESNISTISTLSNISNEMRPHDTEQLLNTIWECTEKTYIQVLDGSYVLVPIKPEDKFHYASPKTLRSLNVADSRKLLIYQAYIDWKYCLEEDDDGNLPIHTAVLNNDLDLLRRQCVILRNVKKSVDLIAQNLTPLQMSIFQDSTECTSLLLQYGADPFITDDEHKTALHLAAMYSSQTVKVILEHCRKKSKDILLNQNSLWKDSYTGKSDVELAKILLDHMCSSFDSQGYTPLMLASKQGHYSNAAELCLASPDTVNTQSPNAGSTALLLTVGEAHIDAINRGNKSTVAEHFKKTVKLLLENDADPTISNFAENNVVLLLSEFNNAELSQLILNLQVDSVSSKITGKKSTIRSGSEQLNYKKCNDIMIVKDDSGNLGVKDIKSTGRKYLDAKVLRASDRKSSKNSREFSAESTENSKTIKINKTSRRKCLKLQLKANFNTSHATHRNSRGNKVNSRNNTEDSHKNTVDSSSNTVDSCSKEANFRCNTLDSCSNTVNSYGNTVNARANTVDSRANSVDSRGNSVDSCSNTVSFSANTVDPRGDMVNFRGKTIDSRGNTMLGPSKIVMSPKKISVKVNSCGNTVNSQSNIVLRPGKIIVSPKEIAFTPISIKQTINVNERVKKGVFSSKPVILENVCLRSAESSDRSLLVKRRKLSEAGTSRT